MWSLCALCVLLSLVPGLNTGGGEHTEMSVRPGSDVLLPLSYKLAIDKTNNRCDTFDWLFEQSKISKSRSCDILDYNNITHFIKFNTSFAPFYNYKSSADGTINLINVTWKNSGKYNVIVNDRITGSVVFTHTYTLHVQAPVSDPFLNVSCRLDGGADIICGTDTREDLLFSIMVNKGLLLENATSSKMVGNEVHTAAASPGPWDITCSVRNHVSDSKTRTNVICPVPLSDPVLEASCLNNGSLSISCSVENGTDTIFFLNVNGTLLSTNVKNGMKRINHVTVSSPDPWDVHCHVNNSLGEKSAKETNITCPVPLSDPVLNVSCHNDRTLAISCSVENGTDPTFSLSVNEELILKNVSTESKRVNVTVSVSESWDVHCSVRNNLGEKNTSKSYKTCPGSNNCSICLQNSIIGGVVSLILTTSPLLIATFFVERNTRQKKP
ncbi:Fc receptor-like protein 5 isoform X2 [Eleutherodactylus coqui]|uniref:Fc receptor-like protein 5 isoform X2 n=1 Tax=Eleutherodactylus coqui TaxID=57060 RepID=UPI0034638469